MDAEINETQDPFEQNEEQTDITEPEEFDITEA